ncbi:hypothetical protein GBAR_LOCUS8129 [Geodia barretti]|uniref:Uncharacterized protein n=1 Tax=Geodia barretti TaxID=519541 RepID=A0AA35RJJ5_GEOBA|nr:hypothetical protein GBAR_LOCUS8129 [Geodia barretti]
MMADTTDSARELGTGPLCCSMFSLFLALVTGFVGGFLAFCLVAFPPCCWRWFDFFCSRPDRLLPAGPLRALRECLDKTSSSDSSSSSSSSSPSSSASSSSSLSSLSPSLSLDSTCTPKHTHNKAM